MSHTYLLEGTKILKETVALTASPYTEQYTIYPLYDNEGSVGGILYSEVPYYFLKNLQGDIIEVKDGAGATVARYTYDAWGRVLSTTAYNTATSGEASNYSTNLAIANANPYRYRGYYYDTETELYYLQSRYYNPKVGRFINADDAAYVTTIKNVTDCNLFAYATNNPVMRSDSMGNNWLTDSLNKIKNGFSSAWNWTKNTASEVAGFFKNTVWKKWIVNAVWKTFCNKWVWDRFCKEWVVNIFIKKWVWETFCKKWTWETLECYTLSRVDKHPKI